MVKKILIVLIIISAFLASRELFKPGYFVMHDDLHMMRQLEMEKCFKDGQIPCRWVPDMGFGYGYPLFNFYPPLPYYLGQIFRSMGFLFTSTAKILFMLQFFLAAITMFVLVNELWGPWAGLLSSIFYTWAPYHATDVYVRGAMNEAWAFIWPPLIFWSSYKLIKGEKLKYLLWLALSFACLLLTHNIMVMIFVPFLLLWCGFWLFKEKRLPWQKAGRSTFLKLAIGAFWALGLAAFFSLPAMAELKHTHVETMFSGYFDWKAHFVSLNQLLITRFWGYGPSLWGSEDGMPFQIGHLHWILGTIIFGYGVFKWLKEKKTEYLLLILLGAVSWFYTFLSHQRSVPVWLIFKPLQMAQFPWRLLIMPSFCFSFLVGYLAVILKKVKNAKIYAGILIELSVLLIVFNFNYFRPEKMGPLPDEQKFSGRAWEFQQTAGIYDYLPKTAKSAAKSAPETDWWFLDGKAAMVSFERESNSFLWQGKVEEPGILQIAVLYFPGWNGWVDGKKTDITYDDELGRMRIFLPAGEHRAYFRFKNTAIRTIANIVSLIAWLIFVGKVLTAKKYFKNAKRN